MCGSFLHPLTCGFVQGVAWQISGQVDADENLKFKENETRKDYLVRLLRDRYNRFSMTVYFNVTRRIFQLTSSIPRQFFHHFVRNLADGIIGKLQSTNSTPPHSTLKLGINSPQRYKLNTHFKIASNVSLNIMTRKFYFLSNARDLPVQ